MRESIPIAFEAAASQGADVVIMAAVSCGNCAGKYYDLINEEYNQILNDSLKTYISTYIEGSDRPRVNYFQAVIRPEMGCYDITGDHKHPILRSLARDEQRHPASQETRNKWNLNHRTTKAIEKHGTIRNSYGQYETAAIRSIHIKAIDAKGDLSKEGWFLNALLFHE